MHLKGPTDVLVGDLSNAPHIPDNTFDSLISPRPRNAFMTFAAPCGRSIAFSGLAACCLSPFPASPTRFPGKSGYTGATIGGGRRWPRREFSGKCSPRGPVENARQCASAVKGTTLSHGAVSKRGQRRSSSIMRIMDGDLVRVPGVAGPAIEW